MNAWQESIKTNSTNTQPWPQPQPLPLGTSLLHYVTTHDVQELRQALERGCLPPDLEAKLVRLAQGDVTERLVARSCRLFIALLLAVKAGSFRGAGPEECERLQQVLAYVRKDDDAIADYKPRGFVDDLREVRAALIQFEPLVTSFKAWRLRQQVPGMWLANPRPSSSVHAV